MRNRSKDALATNQLINFQQTIAQTKEISVFVIKYSCYSTLFTLYVCILFVL